MCYIHTECSISCLAYRKRYSSSKTFIFSEDVAFNFELSIHTIRSLEMYILLFDILYFLHDLIFWFVITHAHKYTFQCFFAKCLVLCAYHIFIRSDAVFNYFHVFNSMCFILISVVFYHKYLLAMLTKLCIRNRNGIRPVFTRSSEEAFSVITAIPMRLRRFPVIVIQVSPFGHYLCLWLWAKLFVIAFCKGNEKTER